MNRTEEREALYTAYSEKVRGYVFGKVANRHDAEDLVSDVFLKAYEKYPTFDADRASVSTWLYTITRNTVIDYFRTHRPGVELPEDLPDAAGIDDGLLQRESLQALGEALNRLDERSRALIVLRYGKGLSLKARRQGSAYPTPTSRYCTAMPSKRFGSVLRLQSNKSKEEQNEKGRKTEQHPGGDQRGAAERRGSRNGERRQAARNFP